MYLPKYVCPAIFIISSIILFGACRGSFSKIEDFEHSNSDGIRYIDDISKLVVPNGFEFKSTNVIAFSIHVINPQIRREWKSTVPVSIWTTNDKSEPVQLASGATSPQCVWTPKLSIPADRDSVELLVEFPGFALHHRVAINRGQTTTYTFGAESNSMGRVIEEVELEEPDRPNGVEIDSVSELSLMGSWDYLGSPNYLTNPAKIDGDILEAIYTNLTHKPSVPDGNPQYLADGLITSVLFEEEGELWTSFAHETSSWRNAIGYYTYPIDNPPRSVDEIKIRTIIFPNASLEGPTGGLKVGDRVYIGKFPANTAVGFFLIPNGYSKSRTTVTDRWSTRYTNHNLNTWSTDEYKQHTVLLSNEQHELMVLGFVDENRPTEDESFNDAVLLIEAKPWSSLNTSHTALLELGTRDSDGDGVANTDDLYPNDSDRAFETHYPAKGTFGSIAFEDSWPLLGDYDFNDLVVDYNFVEILNAKSQIKEIKMTIKVKAIGTLQNNSFALQLPTNPALIERIAGQALSNNGLMSMSSNGTEAGLNTSVIPIFFDSFRLFNTNYGLINTDPEKAIDEAGRITVSITFHEGIERLKLGLPPYDLFMIQNQDRGREVHLAGRAPTGKADVNIFNTEADASNLDIGFFYIDENNLPWAIDIPTIFKYPKEEVKLDKVYHGFNEWAFSGATTIRGWFRDIPGNVDDDNSF